MAHTRAWRNFRRMQFLTLTAAALIYAAATVHAFDRLEGAEAALVTWTVLWPLGFLAASLVSPLAIPPFRRWLAAYVWMSFKSGHGQSGRTIVAPIALLLGAALFIYGQVDAAAAAGVPQVTAFPAYAAGIGILAAQVAMARLLERAPQLKAEIEEPS